MPSQSPMRGESVHVPPSNKKVGLPARPFLYTRDQIATLLDVDHKKFNDSYVYYEGRSVGVKSKRYMVARNINPDPSGAPDWRIVDREFIRWMKVMGFRHYATSAFSF